MQRLTVVISPLLLVFMLTGPTPAVAAERAMDFYFRNAGQPGWPISEAADINDSGNIVGIFDDSGINRGYLKEGKAYTTIHPDGWLSSEAKRIAPNGTIIGDGRDGASVRKAFLFGNDIYTPLLPPGWTGAYGKAVNNSGQAIGYEFFPGAGRGFLYSGGAFTTLQVPGASTTTPNDINEAGVIVGRSTTGGVESAFLYSGGVFSDPAPAGWTETEALRINSRGDILGDGDDGVRTGCWLLSDGLYTTILPPSAGIAPCTDLTEAGDVVGLALLFNGSIVSYVYRDGYYYLYEDSMTNYFLPVGMNSSGSMAGWRIMDHRALEGHIIPTAIVAANGEEGDISIGPASALFLKLSLLSWSFTGRPADWWLIAQTPAGIFSYDADSRSWRPGFTPAASINLRDLKSLKVPGAGKQRGIYTYYFGVDLKQNGVLDYPYWVFDRVSVFVR